MGARTTSAVSGIAAGTASLAAFFGTSELVAIAIGPTSQPVVALGEAVVTHTPDWLKNFAITHFGENDKLALTIGIYVAFAVVAAITGIFAAHDRTWLAIGAIALLGIATGVPAATQPPGSALRAFPSAVGALAAAAFFVAIAIWPKALSTAAASASATAGNANAVPRRQFLSIAGSFLALGAAAYTLGHEVLAKAYSAAASRAAVRLPRPLSATPAVARTGYDIEGLSPYITPNDDFYRVDTALVVPQLSTEGYTLSIHGMVERPGIFSYEDLLRMPLIERPITMVCVSNPVGGPYVGNARWLGVPLAHLLNMAGLLPGAEQLFMTSSDGMTISADLKAVTDGRPAMLAIAMNGEPLPFKHGFPVRAIVPGLYGYASACKWLVDLEVTTYGAKKAYWVKRGYSEDGTIKLESKIETPSSFAQLKAGPVTVAGSAWHPTVGISKVEVSVDGGPWHAASLAAVESVDTWRLWRWEWQATPGSHGLQVRATDNEGHVQTAAGAPVVPDGASGRQSVVVSVT
jgi:DMSO/TMAO reductase YedYZ molybdopterin-dependent catalytic subunit